MALQDIISKILEEAHLSAKDIELEYSKKAELMKLDEIQDGDKTLSDISQRGDVALASVENKIASLARREVKTLHQKAKRDVVDSAMSKFSDFLENISDIDYQKILEKVYQRGDFSDNGKFLVPVARKEVSIKVLGNDVTVITSDKVTSGFIFISDKIEVNMTFSSLIYSQYKNELEIYFGNQVPTL